MLKGMVAFITGAAGSLGSATTKKLISEGMKVVMMDLPDSTGSKLQRILGPGTLFCPGDVTSEDDISSAFKQTEEKFGRLDAIVNCAGVFRSRVLFNFVKMTALDSKELEDCIRVNLMGTLNVIKLGARLLADKEPDSEGLKGVVINTSGFAATDGQLGHAALAASWGAISSMTMPLAREFGPAGIRVVTIAPGLMQSNVTDIWSKKVITHFSEMTPSPKRLGQPDEYAELVKTIISIKFLNGEVIKLDGGLRFALS